MTFEELEQLVETLTAQVQGMQETINQMGDFQTVFSGKLIINKKVQFMQPVYRADGTKVTTINP